VHDAGGKIYCQLWHVGRISHTSLLPNAQPPVSSSAIRAKAQTFTANGFEDTSEPVALDQKGIEETIADYVNASEMAKKAGFDGVEVHAQVGIRLSPLGQANDMSESAPIILFGNVYDYAVEKDLAYLHVLETFPGNEQSAEDEALMKELREKYKGFYIANGGYDAQSGSEAIESHYADAITYGRPFIANPDLPERYKTGAELNRADQDTFYGGGKEGYTDYPFMK